MYLKIEILTTEQEFEKLRDEWQLLAEETDSIFLTYEWQLLWWKTYHKQLEQAELAIITVREKESDKLLAILPLFSHLKQFDYGQKFKTLQLIGTEIESSDYLDLIAPAKRKQILLKKIFSDPKVFKFLEKIDVLLLDNLADGSALLEERQELANILNSAYYHYVTKVCPYLSLPETTEAFWKKLSKNFKSNLKRGRNKLKRAGFTVEVVKSTDLVDAAIENLFKLHDQRFQAKQAHSKFDFERRGKFHQLVARNFLKKNWLQLYQIFDGQKTIGSLYCFKFNGSMMYVQGGFDPEYSQYGLGNQIILRAIEDAIELNFKKFDFMRGSEPYKFKWTSEKLFLHRVILPNSFRAKLFFALQDSNFKVKRFIKKFVKK